MTAQPGTQHYTFPAYDVIEPIRKMWHNHRSITVLVAGDQVANIDAPMRHYEVGSVASYALANHRCPIEAVEKAKKNGHDLWWLFSTGSMVTDAPDKRKVFLGITVGEQVWFEGHLFEVTAEPNSNLGLKLIK